MNFNLSISRVKNIRLSEICLSPSNDDQCYASRKIVIETDEGSFELCLFSTYVDFGSHESLLEVKV